MSTFADLLAGNSGAHLQVRQAIIDERAGMGAGEPGGAVDLDAYRVERVEQFERVYTATPDHVGEIEVTYNRHGNRAIYGLTDSLQVICYAD